jgi:23S rRNA (cytosine1962-C5)-methyltransferase
VYDRDLPEFPLIVERYEDMVYVAEYRSRHGLDEASHEAWLAGSLEVISRVLGVDPDRVYLKERRRKAGRDDQYEKTGAEAAFYIVHEGGLQFLVNLSDYLDTGLFLDHRITRQLVREQSGGKKVLNLFCYTGSFSVYAAAGGAAEVCSVDLSNTYLHWAKRNMELNGFFEAGKTSFVRADVLRYLPGIPDAAYDVAVLDPPTFSNSKMMKDILDIQRDHPALINQVLRVLRPGGILFFSTNLRSFRMDRALINSADIRDITAATTPFDFKGKLQRWCYRITN